MKKLQILNTSPTETKHLTEYESKRDLLLSFFPLDVNSELKDVQLLFNHIEGITYSREYVMHEFDIRPKSELLIFFEKENQLGHAIYEFLISSRSSPSDTKHRFIKIGLALVKYESEEHKQLLKMIQ